MFESTFDSLNTNTILMICFCTILTVFNRGLQYNSSAFFFSFKTSKYVM